MTQRPKVFAYYFPDWHKDPRNASWFGDAWDEWQLVKSATPRFDGHRQPRQPAAGYFDESDPEIASEQISLARSHGVDGFLVDFYWYDDGHYLNAALDRGLLAAENSSDVTIALMWANHELVDIFPLSVSSDERPRRLRDGAIDRAAFERMARHVVQNYFTQPNYYRVEGKPWFSIYEIGNLVTGLGGIDETHDALRWFDDLARAAGFAGVHLDAVIWGVDLLPRSVATIGSESTDVDPVDLVPSLGFSSVTSYVWVHHAEIAEFDFPRADMAALRESAFDEYEDYAGRLAVPFHPNVTVGWDSSPRLAPAVPFVPGDYPAYPVWDSTPEEFGEGLRRARRFVSEHPTPHPIVTINAWNEWSEGSMLLPDTHHGDGFLRQVLEVFGPVENADATDRVLDAEDEGREPLEPVSASGSEEVR
ncbi:hypothetical protein GCM10025867_42780 [Frondihabitans sucicola]|uniref:Glycosyl hydrolase n=1 Tax=Frondihabitans sucicola TaxID=1268041 RepID=A0ABM8GU78_9MICO|nr:glycoside hydrolase family 99-like domain-containing protein [Frondihabitans sucicola]BDZ52037.1 hypothetical protein GCM10025867_42780 [Frondihabitans sucicola]